MYYFHSGGIKVEKKQGENSANEVNSHQCKSLNLQLPFYYSAVNLRRAEASPVLLTAVFPGSNTTPGTWQK